MIDHLTLGVRDLEAARAFYTATLAPLGYRVLLAFDGAVGMGAPAPDGADPGGDFWLGIAEEPSPVHVAFAASSVEQVQAFHAAALAAGGADNGGPGERPQYHPGYYAAFVHDPDGHNIEAVFHGADAH